MLFQKRKFQGERYLFQLQICFNRISDFTIYSKHLKDGSVSAITNVNWIISEFGRMLSGETGNVDWETDWHIEDRTLAEKLWQKTKRAFSDEVFIRHLESELDDDRSCGEWECEYNF